MEPTKWETIYNLGGMNTYSLVEMAECIAEIIEQMTGKSIKIKKTEDDGVLNSALDSSLLVSHIGQYCNTNIDKSIRKIVTHVMLE